MPKINDNVVRVDFRCPIAIYQAIEKLAEENGQPIHHISGKVQISSTIIDLLKTGLAIHAPDSLPQSNGGNLADKLSEKIDDTIEAKMNAAIASLRAELVREIASTQK